MSTTLIDGGPAGPDEIGGQYRNRILTDRTTWWYALGGRQGVLTGFTHSTVAGQMALDYTAGVAAVEERDSLGNTGTSRGYVVWSGGVSRVQFGAASASDRKDAVVVAFCDKAAGAGAFGTETSVVGGQLVVVPGVSGTTTARTDSQIQAAVGSGGWVRIADVLIPAGSTQISAGNVTLASKTEWGDTDWIVLPSVVAGSWGIKYRRKSGFVSVVVDGTFTSTSSTSHTISSSALPAAFRPPTFVRTGGYFGAHPGTVSIGTDGVITAIQQSGASRGSVAAHFCYPAT